MAPGTAPSVAARPGERTAPAVPPVPPAFADCWARPTPLHLARQDGEYGEDVEDVEDGEYAEDHILRGLD
ncbi:hypothetical protein ACIOKD_40055 [Streptomyces sp. NPDC087844]|uniref:hypothetical protein n=1 Tax=Streptomyces sp. NPDC087844 TaxID=3365805 RepID=UPI00382343FC